MNAIVKFKVYDQFRIDADGRIHHSFVASPAAPRGLTGSGFRVRCHIDVGTNTIITEKNSNETVAPPRLWRGHLYYETLAFRDVTTQKDAALASTWGRCLNARATQVLRGQNYNLIKATSKVWNYANSTIFGDAVIVRDHALTCEGIEVNTTKPYPMVNEVNSLFGDEALVITGIDETIPFASHVYVLFPPIPRNRSAHQRTTYEARLRERKDKLVHARMVLG